MLDVMHGRRPATTTRRLRSRAATPTRRDRARAAADRDLPQDPAGHGREGLGRPARRLRADGSLLSELGHDVLERDPPLGLIQLEFAQLWFRGIYEDSLTLPDPSRMESLTKQMAAAGRRLVPPRRRDALLAKRKQTTARMLGLWSTVDVLMTPGLATTAIRAEGGYGQSAPAAIDRAGGSRRSPPSTTSPASRRSRSRPGSAPTGCRSACSWSGDPAPSTRCTRSPLRSRALGRGPSTARSCPEPAGPSAYSTGSAWTITGRPSTSRQCERTVISLTLPA